MRVKCHNPRCGKWNVMNEEKRFEEDVDARVGGGAARCGACSRLIVEDATLVSGFRFTAEAMSWLDDREAHLRREIEKWDRRESNAHSEAERMNAKAKSDRYWVRLNELELFMKHCVEHHTV